MPKQKNESAPTPVKSGIPEPAPDAAQASVSKDAAGAESQAAPTASDTLEDTAPTTPGTAAPTSPHDDKSEAGATKDDAGAESQVHAAQSNIPENSLPPIAEPTSKLVVGECGECFQAVVAPAPTPKPKTPSYIAAFERYCRQLGGGTTSTHAGTETGLSAPAEDGSTGNAEMKQPHEILTAPLPPPRVATGVELFTWIKQIILAQTRLPEDAAELGTFFAISTWFQDVLTILPCLVITGPAHDARVVLHVLRHFCRQPALLAGFQRSHLSVLHRNCKTILASEPDLGKRTADLLCNLTDRNFLVVEGGSLACYSKSTAIYAGENPLSHKIQNSIHIDISPANAAPPATPQGLQKMIASIPVHLDQYRNKNLSYVHRCTWVPSGLSSETEAIATSLGRCIVDAPELRQKLVALLKTQDQQRLYEMSNTTKAIVVEAIWAFIREGRKYAYAGEIATKANRLREARGETARLGPENVGHELKSLGLPTHRISQAGNGLTFDPPTVAKIQQLAAMYVMEDTPAESENLHGSQTTDNN
ncbi:MAG TPA: hypothetical protein VK574_03695 [Terracidiphilus sp.]|nr:hypothetical protein [Terracidiphilus sp.]